MFTKYKFIPYFGDYTTLWNRIHKIKPEIIIPENKEFVRSDDTGLKNIQCWRIQAIQIWRSKCEEEEVSCSYNKSRCL
ncbi:MAG: hypothetical protein QXJ62_05575 [Nitrososphaeria archaeon]